MCIRDRGGTKEPPEKSRLRRLAHEKVQPRFQFGMAACLEHGHQLARVDRVGRQGELVTLGRFGGTLAAAEVLVLPATAAGTGIIPSGLHRQSFRKEALAAVVGVDLDIVVGEVAGIDRRSGRAAFKLDADGDFVRAHDARAVALAIGCLLYTSRCV